MDPDEYRRMNERQRERERIERQLKSGNQNNNNDGGLRVSQFILY